ncbi:MAG: TetR family transcriptional regulator, partial [Dactylosporangium sp.]|nr:TetR family transcriptional regulator [Dactylosporangium sp.]
MRGLTHRAVDRTAGLPEGSTSYYFRTRQALLHAVVERLAELDAAAVPALPDGDLDTLADHAARLMQHWLTAGRDRHLARYEL